MNYNRFKYIYPPHIALKTHFSSLEMFEKKRIFIAQPQLNGNSMQVYTNGKLIITMNRFKHVMDSNMNIDELKGLHRDKGWMVLCGELMDKKQKDENNKIWNLKFVIFDILVYKGKYLLKSTFNERYQLLKELYPNNPVKKHLHQVSKNCFRVNSVRFGFTNIFHDITNHQIYNGLILKKGDSELEEGVTAFNNVNSQMICKKTLKLLN